LKKQKNITLTNKKASEYNLDKDRSYTVITITVFSFFIGSGLSIWLYFITLIDILELSKFIIAFTVVGFLIPLKFYRKWFHFIKYEMVIFNIMGVGPLLTGLFLLSNLIFSSNSITQNYRIEKLYFEGEENHKIMGVVLQNNAFSEERKIVELTDIDPSEVFEKHFLKLTIAKGLFGYEVLKEKELIK